jgi:tRNA (guanine-N7-)-methyltransferase
LTERRRVRSYVRREGRMTAAQQSAIESLWPRYGVDHSAALLDLDALYGRQAPRLVEIGFGNGDALLAFARAHPEWDTFGIEVHRPGAGSLMRRAAAEGLTNLRVSTHDAVEVLRDQFPEASLDAVHLFFPDPWPKKRHHKRRIVQPEFVALVASRLKDGGRFHAATDWVPYAEWMLETVRANPDFPDVDAYSPRPDTRPSTRFEQRGVRLGHEVRDVVCIRRARGA